MAREKGRLFGCPACGFRVSGDEDTCSRCGASFGDKARFECPFCGEPVSPDDVRCPSCMVKFRDFVSKSEKRASNKNIDGLLMTIIEKEAKEVKEQDRKLSCPMCSWLVDGSEETCPKCGIVFSETVAYQCPVCAALISAEMRKCDECGSIFLEAEADERLAAAPGEPPVERSSIEAMKEDIAPAPTAGPERTRGDAREVGHELAEPEAAPEPERPPEPKEEPAPQRPEGRAKAEPRVIVKPKVVRRKGAARPAPEPDGKVTEQTPRMPVKRVRRRKLKAKPKAKP
ncbi:MAG: hypothetical protein JSV90_04000 [Methanobacteriota archaeon]|nr:MAG: hypothetical protein JSV90_04000 [Euryarchaeota archaeon]